MLASIPRGHLASYSQVAELAGLPRQARRVGRILSQLPADSRLPWFRVVNARGKISFPESAPAYRRQLNKLLAEDSAEVSGKLRWHERRWRP